MKIRYADRARIQLDAIGDFFGSVGAAEAGTEVLRRIKLTADKLAEFPDMGHAGSAAGTREMSVKGLPYVIVYERFPEDGDQIVVLNVWHCSQER